MDELLCWLWFWRCRSWCGFRDGSVLRCQRHRWHSVKVLEFESHLHREPGSPTAIWGDEAGRRTRAEATRLAEWEPTTADMVRVFDEVYGVNNDA